MPRDGGHLPKPVVGQHLVLKGAWVLDTQHGWQEIHPVWSVTVNGHTYKTGWSRGPVGCGVRLSAESGRRLRICRGLPGLAR